MMFASWLRWLKRPSGGKSRAPRSFVPRLDILEDRAVPSALHGAVHLGDHGSGVQGPPALVSHFQCKHHDGPDLGEFQNLQVPAGNKFVFHTYAKGVQVYRWNGTSWTFVAPEAGLYADAEHRREVGTHYAGPTWESPSGSKVVGAVVERATPSPNSIDWLLLKATSTEGHGGFARVSYIQRVNTVGGKAPTTPGTSVGQEVRVPYTAEYYFYRAHQHSSQAWCHLAQYLDKRS